MKLGTKQRERERERERGMGRVRERERGEKDGELFPDVALGSLFAAPARRTTAVTLRLKNSRLIIYLAGAHHPALCT